MGSGNDFVDFFGINNNSSASDTADGGAGNDSLSGNSLLGGYNGVLVMDAIAAGAAQSGKWTLPIYASASGGSVTSTFVNFEYFQFYTGTSNDTMVGSANSRGLYFSGGTGNDVLDDGGGTNMTLAGGFDNDVFFVRSYSTQIIESYSPSYNNVNSVNTTLSNVDLSLSRYGGGGMITNLTYLDPTASIYNSSSNTWNTTLLGSGDFTGIGNDLNNVITSGSGNDSLVGGAGADTLIGNAGNDYLRGGDRATGTDSANRFGNTNGVSGLVNAASGGSTFAAPDGTTNAFIISNADNSGMHYGQFNLGSSSTPMTFGVRYTGTIFARKATSSSASHIVIAAEGNTNGTWIAVNLDKMASGNTVLADGVVYAGNLPSGETFSVTYDALTGWYQFPRLSSRSGL
jgi:Ca2+-binding RTX toxin-like protein